MYKFILIYLFLFSTTGLSNDEKSNKYAGNSTKSSSDCNVISKPHSIHRIKPDDLNCKKKIIVENEKTIKPYCQKTRFSLQYGVIPGIQYCIGTPKIQIAPGLYYGIIAATADLSLIYNFTPKEDSTWFLGTRIGASAAIIAYGPFMSFTVGYHFGSISLELGPSIHKFDRGSSKDPLYLKSVDLRVGF